MQLFYLSKLQISQFFLISLLLFAIFQANAQKYTDKITSAKLEIKGQSVDGYGTNFDFSEKAVRKGFWKYCKSFARPLNQKKYYEVTIPASENEGTVDLIIFGQSVDVDGSTDFYLAFDNSQVPVNQTQVYSKQTRTLLIDFKENFYVDHFQSLIDKKTKDTRKLSKRYEKLVRTKKDDLRASELLEDIKLIESEIAGLQKRLFEVSR